MTKRSEIAVVERAAEGDAELVSAEEIVGGTPGDGLSSAVTKVAEQLRPRTERQRRWVMGLGPQLIEPGQGVTVQTRPRCVFRSERAIVTGETDGLVVGAIFVGQRAQHQHLWGRPVTELNGDLPLDVAPALDITFSIRNTDSIAHTFALSLMGVAVIS